MKSPRYSKAALKTTLQLCAASMIVCALMVGFMSTRRAAAERRSQRADQEIQAARGRLEQATNHRALIDKYQERYQQLVREGLKVRFDRAVAGDWFEAAIPTTAAGLVDNYVIGKDSPFTGPETADLTAFRVVSHRLDFTANVAHEDEFADLVTTIERRVPGITAEEACALTRNRESAVGAQPLTVRCALVWYEFTTSSADPAANPGN
ncbi:MAG: hypothetical protein QOI88_440 [Gammaproteobacteria bacterium]|jgi:hypothetical protein|nr:hypothetical protein [Gammaproteobacteria bacterium]